MGRRVLRLGQQGNRWNPRKFPYHCSDAARALGPISRNRYQNEVGLLLAQIRKNFIKRLPVECITQALGGCIYARALNGSKNRRHRSAGGAAFDVVWHVVLTADGITVSEE